MKGEKVWIGIILLISLIFYLPSLFYYFSQDDFIHLFASHAKNIPEFLNFFNPYAHFPDIFFYRPLATQFYFFLNHSLFGLNPLPFHIEALAFHGLNTFLFYLLIKKIWNNPRIAILSAFLYGISSIHFLSLYYISAFQQLARTSFMLGSILLFIKHSEKNSKSSYLGSIFCFLGAILSKETSLILPFLILAIESLRQNDKPIIQTLKLTIKKLIPFLLILTAYLLFRITGFQVIFSQGSYSYTTSIPEILQNIKWYLIWSTGLPEILQSYPSLKPASLIQFSKDHQLALFMFISLALSLITISTRIFNLKKLPKKLLLLSFLLFSLPLLPVIFLHGHLYPQYLDLPMLGLLPIICSLIIGQKFHKIFILIFLTLFTLTQITSLEISRSSHWTTHRSDVAQHYSKFLLPTSSFNSVTFIGTPTQLQEVSYALAQKYAPLVWSQGQITKTNYSTTPTSSPLSIPITRY